MVKNPFNLNFLLVFVVVWNSPLLAPYLGFEVIPAMQIIFLCCGVSLFIISSNKKCLNWMKNNAASIDEANNACKIAGMISIIGSLALFA